MSEEERTVLIIKGTIADLSEDDRAVVMKAYAVLVEMIKESPLAGLAIALIGAELSV